MDAKTMVDTLGELLCPRCGLPLSQHDWHSVAPEFEKAGDFEGADQVFLEGFKNNSQPTDELEEAAKNYVSRVVEAHSRSVQTKKKKKKNPDEDLSLLLGPLDVGGGRSGEKGPDSPNDSSAVTSPTRTSHSHLSSPRNQASRSSPASLSPSRSERLNSTAGADQRARSRRKLFSRKGRNTSHVYEEHKQRTDIKKGFGMLRSLIPELKKNPNAKVSRAAILWKSADYIQQLQAEWCLLHDEMASLRQQNDSLRQQNECLNTPIIRHVLHEKPLRVTDLPSKNSNNNLELGDGRQESQVWSVFFCICLFLLFEYFRH